MTQRFRVPGALSQRLEELEVSPPAVLRHARLAQDTFDQPRILLSTEELFALWEAIGAVSRDSAIGLKLGTETRTERFHPSGLAALSTENFRAAMDHLARYKQLTCPEEVIQEIDDDEWRIRFRWTHSADTEPPTLIDMCFAWLQSIGRHGSGTRVSPVRVEFVSERSQLKTFEKHFGCDVVSRAPENAIVFRAADAALPFITRNAELLDMLAPQFEKELAQNRKPDSLLDLARGAIQQRLTGNRPTIDDIARDLHMSGRSLQRKLQEAGSSYQRLLDEARHRMARYYLGNSVLELNETAYLLGYEDSNSFTRAFRGWEGVPPGAWRESRRETAAS
jgi:AraC-like DNA-binding protein